MEMRKWMGLSTSVSNAEIGLPSHCWKNNIKSYIKY